MNIDKLLHKVELLENSHKQLKKQSDLKDLPVKDKKAYLDEEAEKIYQLKQELLQAQKQQLVTIYGQQDNEEAERSSLWLKNHADIISAIEELCRVSGSIPGITEIASYCNLSRQTIYSHLHQFKNTKYKQSQASTLALMKDNLLAKVYQQAANKEDLKAARIFLEFATKAEKAACTNYIQVNNTFIDQQAIEQLPEEKKQELEELLRHSNIISYDSL